MITGQDSTSLIDPKLFQTDHTLITPLTQDFEFEFDPPESIDPLREQVDRSDPKGLLSSSIAMIGRRSELGSLGSVDGLMRSENLLEDVKILVIVPIILTPFDPEQ